MIFSDLYGNELDRELGTADRARLFTVARRKAAINAAQLEWAKRTESYQRRAEIVLTDDTQEYDLEAVSDFLWLAKEGCSIRITGQGSGRYRSEVIEDAPVGYWRLDELSGTVAADSSGAGHNGTYTGGVALGATGVIASNTAATFDGVNDYVTMGDVNAYEFQSAFAVEFWAKYTATQPLAAIVGKMSAAINSGWAVFEYSGQGYIQFYGVTGAGSLLWDFHTDLAYNDGAWHHVVCAWDGTTNANGLKIYVDGVVVKTATALTGTPGTTSTPFAIGSFGALSSGFFGGTVDEVALYTELSAARVLAHYNAGFAVRYIEGDDLLVTTVARLNTDEPGWRSVSSGSPRLVYQRRVGGQHVVGLHPMPSIASTEGWTLLAPYVAMPVDMSADSDEPFTLDGDPIRSLRPWHRALAYWAAHDLEQFRKDQQREGIALKKWEAEVERFLGNEKPRTGGRIRLARDYRRGRTSAWQRDPRRW